MNVKSEIPVKALRNKRRRTSTRKMETIVNASDVK
jgi:hypothetical protein